MGGNVSLLTGPVGLDAMLLLPANGREGHSLGEPLETLGVPALGNLHGYFHP